MVCSYLCMGLGFYEVVIVCKGGIGMFVLLYKIVKCLKVS